MEKLWAVYFVLSSTSFAASQALDRKLLLLQQALAVCRAAQLPQGSPLYASVLRLMLHTFTNPSEISGATGDLIPFEGFIHAVAVAKQATPKDNSEVWARVDSYVEEHRRWVVDLQIKLVRCMYPPVFACMLHLILLAINQQSACTCVR